MLSNITCVSPFCSWTVIWSHTFQSLEISQFIQLSMTRMVLFCLCHQLSMVNIKIPYMVIGVGSLSCVFLPLFWEPYTQTQQGRGYIEITLSVYYSVCPYKFQKKLSQLSMDWFQIWCVVKYTLGMHYKQFWVLIWNDRENFCHKNLGSQWMDWYQFGV